MGGKEKKTLYEHVTRRFHKNRKFQEIIYSYQPIEDLPDTQTEEEMIWSPIESSKITPKHYHENKNKYKQKVQKTVLCHNK